MQIVVVGKAYTREIHGNRFNPLFSIYSPAIACHHQIITLMLRIITPCMAIRNITRKCKKYNFPFHLSVMKHDSTPNHISCQLLSRDLCICLIYELDIWYYFIYGNQKAVWNYILCNKSLNEMIYLQELIPHINRFINGLLCTMTWNLKALISSPKQIRRIVKIVEYWWNYLMIRRWVDEAVIINQVIDITIVCNYAKSDWVMKSESALIFL